MPALMFRGATALAVFALLPLLGCAGEEAVGATERASLTRKTLRGWSSTSPCEASAQIARRPLSPS
jgi:hypothetical protein